MSSLGIAHIPHADKGRRIPKTRECPVSAASRVLPQSPLNGVAGSNPDVGRHQAVADRCEDLIDAELPRGLGRDHLEIKRHWAMPGPTVIVVIHRHLRELPVM